jgi:hypothetical protein
MIFGSAYHSVGEIHRLCEKVVGASRVQILYRDDLPAHRRAYVVVGLVSLHRVAGELSRCKATVVVLDSIPALRRIQGLRALDYQPGADAGEWNPRPIRMSVFKSDLVRRDPTIPSIAVTADVESTNLVSEIQDRGVLDKVLTYSQKIDQSTRPALSAIVARYLAGGLALSTLSRRTKPNVRSPKLVTSHSAMIESLGSEQGKRLQEAIKAVASGEDPVLAAARFRVDAFEVRYITAQGIQSRASAK